MRKREIVRKRKNVARERGRKRTRARQCVSERVERVMAKEERSRFIPRAFVNLPREHITTIWSSLQTEMRKVGGGFVAL